ncbi:MAG: sugar phosphate isomerase/epimerase [Phycisphaerae bacterium]|nr:sugar phosphate isomerase/epimerase [Phycisphaerae bacterium]MDW8260933.1 sugar phosphate isomerase/epimerase [Phycisphaerales bacterium]
MNPSVAIQSWCFRHFKPLPDFLSKLKECGVEATELCGVHVDFSEPDCFRESIEHIASANVRIVCIGVQYLTGEKEKDRPGFEFCRMAGVGNMSISFGPEAFPAGLKHISELAEEYDLLLGIHNHGGRDWLGNRQMLKHVLDRCSPRIGLHLDTAWALDSGEDPCQLIEEFAGRLSGVHVKDFVFDRSGKPQDVVIGEGNLDLPRMMNLLRTSGFTGPLVIEYEADVENPVPALRRCVQKLRALL